MSVLRDQNGRVRHFVMTLAIKEQYYRTLLAGYQDGTIYPANCLSMVLKWWQLTLLYCSTAVCAWAFVGNITFLGYVARTQLPYCFQIAFQGANVKFNTNQAVLFMKRMTRCMIPLALHLFLMKYSYSVSNIQGRYIT